MHIIIRLLRKSGKSQREIAATCNVSRSSVQRNCKHEGQVHRCHRGRGGRKRLLSKRQECLLVRNVQILRKTEGPFTSARIKSACRLMHVSDRTMRRAMNRLGFKYRQARKKGLVTDLDPKKRVGFAKKMTRQYPPNVWTDHACLTVHHTIHHGMFACNLREKGFCSTRKGHYSAQTTHNLFIFF